MIRFGSRVEVALPRGARLVAKEGAIVRAGETTIAEVADGARA
jgi:phosphatidylserine decarboxylase